MAILARASYALRRAVAERCGMLLAGLTAWWLASNRFAGLDLSAERWEELALCGALLALLGARILVGRPVRHHRFTAAVDRLELGALLLAVCYVAIQAAGTTAGWAQPLAYVLVAYLVGFNGRLVGLALTLVAIALQLTLHRATGELPAEWRPAALQCGFIALFAFANLLFLQLEVARRRREHDRRLADEIRAMREEARDFRLISSALAGRAGEDRTLDESKLARGAVEAIHQGMFFVLDLLKKSLDLQTCVLLWLDAEGRQLRIKEMVTDSSLVNETPISAQAGAIGGVIKNRLLLNLRSQRRGARGIPYYTGPEQVGAFIGVPVLEDGHIRGVLCADRRQERSFAPHEEQLMGEAARQIIRAIQTERVFAAVERSKYEHERFYQASTMLNGTLTLAQVYETAFQAARAITDFEFGALTLYDSQRRRHTIVRVLGEDQERFEGHSFGNNAGLVAMVVKNRHFLPAGGGGWRDQEPLVFTRKLRLRRMSSLVVIPLIVNDRAIGTIVLASTSGGRFRKEVREMLGVIANQVAVSIENAKMYKRMEEMATTDGLTGLPNHRTFQARLAEMLMRAQRHEKPVSVVLTDIDKFKSVNDTYGHPIGDQVLKRVAKVVAQQVRKVDIVARYGGEEFAIVLEETDGAGAKLLCERVREEVAAQVMNSDKGAFRVTLSLGIASYPDDGMEQALLIERADQALYAAKQGGRNRSVRYDQMRAVTLASSRAG